MKEPLTTEIYKGHVDGTKRIGVYPLHNGDGTGPGGWAKWIAADIDDKDFKKALNIKQRLDILGIEAYIERSKSKGYHIFSFFNKDIEAYKLRLVYNMVLDQLGIKCELFPKQDEVKDEAFGNFINLPLFGADIHDDKTVFIDDKEEVIMSTVADLHEIKINDVKVIEEIVELNRLERKPVTFMDSPVMAEPHKPGALKTPPCVDKIKTHGVKAGQRNEATFRMAVYYKERNVPAEEVFALLVEWNKKNTKSKTPIEQQHKEIKDAVTSVFRGDYKAFSCGEGNLAEYCNKEECPIVHYAQRKKDIEEGIITMVFRDFDVMVFRQKQYEFRMSGFEFTKGGKFRSSLTLSKEKKIIYKDIVNLDFAASRKRYIRAATDPDLEESLIKLQDLVRQQLEKEEKEKLLKPKQLYIMTEQEKEAAIEFLKGTPNILGKVMEITNRMGVVGEETLRLMVYLCFTSRTIKEPLSMTVKGESSSGKSFSCQNVQKLIPEEGYHFMTRATQQAFYHMPEDGLQNRIVYINELPGSESADYSIRSAQSEGDLILYLPIKDPATGDMMTISKRVKGPVGFLVTTTKSGMFDENETRNFAVFSDDSPQLTKNIGNITIRRAMGEEFKVDDAEINLWKNMQRLLNPDYKVIIPYAKEVFQSFPDKPVRIRRDRERFRVLLEIITILHQYHREKKKIKEDGSMGLISTLADYHIAKTIAESLLTYTIYEIGPASEEIWENILEMKKKFEGKPENANAEFTFKYKDIAEEMDWTVEKVKKWMLSLQKTNLIEYSEKSTGGKGKAALFVMSDRGKTIEFSSSALGFLPSIKDLFEKYPCDKDLFYNPVSGIMVDPCDADVPEGLLDE